MTEIVVKHRTTRHMLDGLNVNMDAGPDGISSPVLKRCAPEHTPNYVSSFPYPSLQEFFQENRKTLRIIDQLF